MAVFKPNGNWDRTFSSPGGMVGRWLTKVSLKTEVEAKRRVGVDTGRLRASIKGERRPHKVPVNNLEVDGVPHQRGNCFRHRSGSPRIRG
jgi:hypothetical protein